MSGNDQPRLALPGHISFFASPGPVLILVGPAATEDPFRRDVTAHLLALFGREGLERVEGQMFLPLRLLRFSKLFV